MLPLEGVAPAAVAGPGLDAVPPGPTDPPDPKLRLAASEKLIWVAG